MESLNLNTLASSLPTAHQNAEKELLDNFKAAALSITTLYRSSRHTSKRAYNAGYASACQDLLMMIQQGVSVGGIGPSGSPHDAEGSGMTIGKVMDWIEARLDAIKSREEEEDEDEEKEKDKERGRAAKPDSAVPKAPIASTSTARPKDQAIPLSHNSNSTPSRPTSPSPPPPMTLRSIQHSPHQPRSCKSRGPPLSSMSKESMVQEPGFHNGSDGVQSSTIADTPIPIAAGAKRRHAVMMMLDSTSTPVTVSASPAGTSHSLLPSGNPGSGGMNGGRRRTRSSRTESRNLAMQNQNISLMQASEAMDVEEDGGRERKRVARR